MPCSTTGCWALTKQQHRMISNRYITAPHTSRTCSPPAAQPPIISISNSSKSCPLMASATLPHMFPASFTASNQSSTSGHLLQAYRQLARTLHPDKGGSTAGFAALQAAFETLSDPKARAAYDSLAPDLRFRPGAAKPYGSSSSSQQDRAGTPPPPPGVTEAMLLQQLLQRGAAHPYAVFDPMSQLCVTCEVCAAIAIIRTILYQQASGRLSGVVCMCVQPSTSQSDRAQ